MWKDRPSDTPIRTIKTIIHTLVRLQGEAVLSHLGTIDNLKDSELEAYLQKLLKSGVSKEKDAASKMPLDHQSDVVMTSPLIFIYFDCGKSDFSS